MEDDSDYEDSYVASEVEDYPTSEDGDYGYDPQTEPEISMRRVRCPVGIRPETGSCLTPTAATTFSTCIRQSFAYAGSIHCSQRRGAQSTSARSSTGSHASAIYPRGRSCASPAALQVVSIAHLPSHGSMPCMIQLFQICIIVTTC